MTSASTARPLLFPGRADRPGRAPLEETIMAKQHYSSQINLRVPGRDDLAVVYYDFDDVPGLTAAQVVAKKSPTAMRDVPGGRIVGYRVTTDGIAR